MKNVLLIGGSGLLGSELLKINRERKDCKMFAPASGPNSEDKAVFLNINDLGDAERNPVKEYIFQRNIDLIVNCAAFTDVLETERDPTRAIYTNAIGACNVLLACMNLGKKLVYISTDHVFDGKKGQYRTTDSVNPLTKYAKTKTAGELCVSTYDNSLVIRTSFFGYEFPFEKAFVDQYSSKDYLDIIAPKVYDVMMSDKIGIVHVGSKRRSLYEIARKRREDVQACSKEDFVKKYPIPSDTSLYIEGE